MVARHAFTAGLHTIAAISTALLGGIAILIAVTLRHIPPIGGVTPTEADQEIMATATEST